MIYKKIIAITLIFTAIFCGSTNVYNTARAEDKDKRTEQLYGIGSVSKVYTTAAVMKLVDEGKINLDEPVKTYIPEFQMADERYKKITVRMLLNHSSGLNGGTSINTILLNDNSTYNHDNFLENLKEQKLKADPGEYSVYCNDGFTLAEILVERVSGISFTDFLEQNFFNKLGLSNTKTPQNSQGKNFADIYFNNTSLKIPNESANVIGSGGIYSTAEDMCKFSGIFMNKSNGILTTNSAKATMNDETYSKFGATHGDSLMNYGLGWDSINTYPFNKFKIKALTKGGDTNSYHGALVVLPYNNISAAVLSSGGSSNTDELIAQSLVESVLKNEKIIKDFSKYEKSDVEKQADIPKEIKQNAGYYCSGKMLKIQFKDNKLLITTLDDEINLAQEYIYTDKGYFLSTNGGYISTSGEISSAENGFIGNTKLYFKKEHNNTYIYIQSYEKYPGLGETAAAMPYAQKVEENTLKPEVLKAWKKRNNKKYYLINEKYTSTYYLLNSRNHIKISLSSNLEGYLKNTDLYKNNMIIDENYAKDFLKLPGVIGRDTNDFKFYKNNGTEYLKLPALKDEFISEDAIKNIDFSKHSIKLSDSSTQWFNIKKSDCSKEIDVKIKGAGAYYVYDKYDNCIDTSCIKNKKTKITLPDGGKIAFAGEAGTEFTFS